MAALFGSRRVVVVFLVGLVSDVRCDGHYEMVDARCDGHHEMVDSGQRLVALPSDGLAGGGHANPVIFKR